MRFLVIGASGFVGSNIFAYLRAMGHEVLGTQCKSQKKGLIQFDLLNQNLEECIKPEYLSKDRKVFVIICAALSQIDRCLLERDISYKINVENTIKLIKYCINHNATPVFLSTSAVYDGHLGYYNEDSPHAPICEYGRHKDEVEHFLLKEAPQSFILRLDKIIGGDPDGKHMFADWYQTIREGKQIICIDQLFSPTYVNDIAKAILIASTSGLTGAYNVATPEFFTRLELAKQFVAATGKEVEIVLKSHEEFNFADPRLVKSYLDGSRFINKTGMRFTSMRKVFHSFLSIKEQLNGLAK